LRLSADAVLSAGVTSYALTDGDIPKYNPVWTELDCSCVWECQYYVAYHQNHHDNNWYCPSWAGALLTAWCLFTTKEYNQYTFNHHASLGAFAQSQKVPSSCLSVRLHVPNLIFATFIKISFKKSKFGSNRTLISCILHEDPSNVYIFDNSTKYFVVRQQY